MSRLNFAPKLNEIEITDIENGLGAFTPKADKPISFTVLNDTLKKAGYTLASAKVTVAGKLQRDATVWWLVADTSGQRFVLAGDSIDQSLPGATSNKQVEVTGDWKTVRGGTTSREVITPLPVKKAERQNGSTVNAPQIESVNITSGEPLRNRN